MIQQFISFKYIFAKVIKFIIVLYFIPINYIFDKTIILESFYISFNSNIYIYIYIYIR